MLDTIVRGGLVVDGSGASARIADIGIRNGVIEVIGAIAQAGAQEIDARGLVVTPGFVDIHTHYDGQAVWDPYLSPSCLHGVTTVVMGNCGVGFAPVRAGERDWLIRLMEGVEDIPGTVLAEGIDWQWESFPQYLAALRRKRFALDVAAQIPHGPLRTWVMGSRGADPTMHPTEAEIRAMGELVSEALALGAIGFSTSRTVVHRSSDGKPTPSLSAKPAELLGIARAMRTSGRGIFEIVSDFSPLEHEFALIREIAAQSGRQVSVALTQTPEQPDAWRRILELIAGARAEGLDIHAQVAARPISVLMGLSNRVNFLAVSASYRALMGLPLDEQAARLREPDTKRRILAELDLSLLPSAMLCDWNNIFRFDATLPYLPPRESSVAVQAARSATAPEFLAYDWLLEGEGRHFLYTPVRNYAEASPAVLREMIQSELTVIGLADGGAHCAVLSDAGMPTFVLTQWREQPDGKGFALEWLVQQLTQRPAEAWGFIDRGLIAPGKRADLNLIDLERLALRMPAWEYDLPAGGGRLVQDADGYVMTLVAGVPTVCDGVTTGLLPGRLLT
ncbi:MAG TPA: amidohydrolase family protein [Pseudomonadales bacterium]|nr:amidohydrolase family protein [Pseudomonadales bacterium]